MTITSDTIEPKTAIGCEIVHFLKSLTGGKICGTFLLWATWAHEYLAIVVKIDGHRTSGRFKRAGGM